METKRATFRLRIRTYTTLGEVVDFVTFYQNLYGEDVVQVKIEKSKGTWTVLLTVNDTRYEQ